MGLAPNQSTRVERREDVHICKEKVEKVCSYFETNKNIGRIDRVEGSGNDDTTHVHE